MSTLKIQELGLEAERAFVKAMAVSVLDTPEVLAIYDGLDQPLVSVVMDCQCSLTRILELIQEVSAFYQNKTSDWAWIIGPLSKPKAPDLAKALLKQGFILEYEYPGMYLSLEEVLPEQSQLDLTIEELKAEDDLSEWIKPVGSAFPPSNDQGEGYRRLLTTIARGPDAMMRHFIGYHQNQAVCAGTLFIHHDSVMIHNIATNPAFQRRYFGSALVCHLLHLAKSAGKKHCFLDASSKGKKVYERLGFETYALQSTYTPKKL